MGSFAPLKAASRDEQLGAIEEKGVAGALYWSDVLTDIEANQVATKLYGEAVARIVRDPDTAASLVPTYPFGCKRPIIDEGYYETFNRDNVTLVDLRKDPIREITPTGIRTEHAGGVPDGHRRVRRRPDRSVPAGGADRRPVTGERRVRRRTRTAAGAKILIEP